MLPRQVDNPGFFQGTAGIGYELLRMARPDLLPSVLVVGVNGAGWVRPYERQQDHEVSFRCADGGHRRAGLVESLTWQAVLDTLQGRR